MAAVLDVRLDEDGAVAERALRLAPGLLDLCVELGEVAHDPHPAPAATGGGLDQQRQVGLGRRRCGCLEHRNAGPAMIRFASILEPIASIDSGVGPTQVSPASSTARAKSAFSDRKP